MAHHPSNPTIGFPNDPLVVVSATEMGHGPLANPISTWFRYQLSKIAMEAEMWREVYMRFAKLLRQRPKRRPLAERIQRRAKRRQRGKT